MEPAPNPTPPPAYTDEQLRAFREAFAPQAARYRSHLRSKGFLLTLGGVLVLWGWSLLPKAWKPVGLGPAIILVMNMFKWHEHRTPSLTCTACQGVIDFRYVCPYCPECGSDRLTWPPGPTRPSCVACRTSLLAQGTTRPYKIHACTHCGVRLDDQGF